MVFKRSCNQLMGSNFRKDLTYHDHYLSPRVHQEKTSEWAETNTRPPGLCTRRLQGMPSQQAISSAAAFKLGHGHPGLTHIAERREHNICPEWFLCRRGKAAPASIVNDACLQKVSMHTCMHALQARCSVMFPCCAHRANTYWAPNKGPYINDVQ